jgi:hypothetical protein
LVVGDYAMSNHELKGGGCEWILPALGEDLGEKRKEGRKKGRKEERKKERKGAMQCNAMEGQHLLAAEKKSTLMGRSAQ